MDAFLKEVTGMVNADDNAEVEKDDQEVDEKKVELTEE